MDEGESSYLEMNIFTELIQLIIGKYTNIF